MSLSVHIPQFEGPLALLIHLIRQKEMDILDIDIHLITSEYLEYIKKMKQLDLEVAGDFIAMAATLIQIKSKMLLPDSDEDEKQEEGNEGDPRETLVKKLLEYRSFQSAGKKLYDRPLLGRDIYKPFKKNEVPKKENPEIVLQDNALFSLMTHYVKALRQAKKVIHRVRQKTRSIASRILEIRDCFLVNQKIRLRELVGKGKELKEELLITFLSCLELSKMGFISISQAKQYGEIYLVGKRPLEENVISQVEEYSGSHTEKNNR